MTDTTDKEWASKYLLDPLTAPEPRDETGPGTHFTSSINSNHRQEKQDSISAAYPTPPSSASPSRSTFSSNNQYSSVKTPHSPSNNPYSSSRRREAFGRGEKSRRSRAGSLEPPVAGGSGGGLSRSVSLNNGPLDTIRKETKVAHRSPHLRKKHVPTADTIDALDRSFGFAYHHEGPYDATLLRRNLNPKYSPVEAVRGSNAEALKATPREHIRDALDRHLPLQGVAIIPPGEPDHSGRTMRYEEGADLMREPDAAGGAYRRWPDMKYHPDDLKGKGEPSYTIEKALKKNDDSHKRIVSDGGSAYEMQSQTQRPATSYSSTSFSSRMANTPPRRLTRHRSQSDNDAERAMNMDPRLKGMNTRTSAVASGSGSGSGPGRGENVSDNTGTKLGHGLKKRFGSLRIGKHSGGKTNDN